MNLQRLINLAFVSLLISAQLRAAITLNVDGATSGASGRYEVSQTNQFVVNLNLNIISGDFQLDSISVIAQRKNNANDLTMSLFTQNGLKEAVTFLPATVNQGNLTAVTFQFSEPHALTSGMYSIVFSAPTTSQSQTYTFSAIGNIVLRDASTNAVVPPEQLTFTFTQGDQNLPIIPEPSVFAALAGVVCLVWVMRRRR